ncbi:MAG TPA: serine protease [Chitinophagaceae bacterium]|nr:serine protease [Chitinophagaceae bacterium]
MKYFKIIIILIISCQSVMAQDFIPDKYLEMTFNIKSRNQYGTSFLISYNSRQYFVTARHLFANPVHKQKVTFDILKDTTWITLNGTLLISDTSQIDIAVIEIDASNYSNKAMPFKLGNTTVLGDEGYFLGFPFGLNTKDNSGLNSGFPYPLIKKVTFSGGVVEKGIYIIFLDGHNNPGFSGGPVIFIDRYSTSENKWFISGVISAYVNQKIQMVTPFGTMNYDENSGIIISIHAKHIITIIERK